MKRSINGGMRRGQRWFFATDIHGSDRCFRKFLAAARSYRADVLLLGGDLGGKGIVPIVEDDAGYSVTFQGEQLRVRESGVCAIAERIRFNGLYPYTCTHDEVERLRDPASRDEVFAQLIRAQIREWNRLAASRLDDSVRCIVTPGNDDPGFVDEELIAARRFECPEGQVVHVGSVQLASLGSANFSPWQTGREYPESELAGQIESMLRTFQPADGPLVFNFHCPPRASGLDSAVAVDETFRPVLKHGHVQMSSAGSAAVRDAIERYQPVVGLHGHIHESCGTCRIGRTRCFNPGSEYGSGVLRGVIIDFDPRGECSAYVFTTG